MRTLSSTILALALVVLLAGCARQATLPSDLAGVHLGDEYEAVQARLEANGATLNNEKGGAGGAKQVWDLADGPYQQLMIKFSDEYVVAYMTAYVGKRESGVRFDAIGPLEAARQVGQYFYSWHVPDPGGGEGHIVRAQGIDPERLDAISLYPARDGIETIFPDADG